MESELERGFRLVDSVSVSNSKIGSIVGVIEKSHVKESILKRAAINLEIWNEAESKCISIVSGEPSELSLTDLLCAPV